MLLRRGELCPSARARRGGRGGRRRRRRSELPRPIRAAPPANKHTRIPPGGGESNKQMNVLALQMQSAMAAPICLALLASPTARGRGQGAAEGGARRKVGSRAARTCDARWARAGHPAAGRLREGLPGGPPAPAPARSPLEPRLSNWKVTPTTSPGAAAARGGGNADECVGAPVQLPTSFRSCAPTPVARPRRARAPPSERGRGRTAAGDRVARGLGAGGGLALSAGGLLQLQAVPGRPAAGRRRGCRVGFWWGSAAFRPRGGRQAPQKQPPGRAAAPG
jgi:hypothetical protein